MKEIRLIATMKLWTIGTFIFCQCPSINDTIPKYARNYYQDKFELMYKNEAINQYSDFHGKIKYGMWYFFRTNGDVESYGHYEFGLKQGWWFFFNRDGILVHRRYYKHGQLLCDVNTLTGKQHENTFKDKDLHGYKLSDSKYW